MTGKRKIKKHKILVALSGGVDSSVAAALLVRQGYDVTGMFAINYRASLSELRPTSCDDSFTGRSVAKPCWQGDYQDALRVCAKLGIKLLRWDFTKDYQRDVISYLKREYRAGRTPNPDVLCNKFVKFGAWLDKARKAGFDFLATGHYARVEEQGTGNREQVKSHNVPRSTFHVPYVALCASADANKDQTYFLHQLSQAQLKHVMFPLGDYTKPQVRALAKKFNLPTAEKAESMGICFVGERPMKEFLQEELKIKPRPGKIVMSLSTLERDGSLSPSAKRGIKGELVVGEHAGLAFYTIGQRVGLHQHCHSEPRAKNPLNNKKRSFAIAQDDNTQPLYVVGKDSQNNILIVGHENDPLLYKKEITIKNIHWIAGKPPKLPLKCLFRLRHRQDLQSGILRSTNKSSIFNLQSLIKQRAVTPGQFAVIYLPLPKRERRGSGSEECLGGGVIQQ